ncbi:MAG: helix-turn-helix domain-containing protein [Planctomycetaceae bacterium]
MKIPISIMKSDLSPAAKLVFTALCDRTGKNKSCWPSQRTIAADAGLTLKVANRAIKELMDRDIVRAAGGGMAGPKRKRVYHYWIRPGIENSTLPKGERQRSRKGNVERSRKGISNVVERVTEPDQLNQTNSEPGSGEPSAPAGRALIEPQENAQTGVDSETDAYLRRLQAEHRARVGFVPLKFVRTA